MTFQQNRSITAQPNVLSDQTVPNTLSGFSDPNMIARRRLPAVAPVAVWAVVVAAAVAALLVVAGRIG